MDMVAGWMMYDEEPEVARAVEAQSEPIEWRFDSATRKAHSRVRIATLRMHTRHSTMRMTSLSRILKPSRA